MDHDTRRKLEQELAALEARRLELKYIGAAYLNQHRGEFGQVKRRLVEIRAALQSSQEA